MNKFILNLDVRDSRVCLGHEIHIYRIILLDLLCKGLIDTNVEIYTLPDRIFLYSKIFPNCFPIQSLENKEEAIDLTSCLFSEHEGPKQFIEMNYDHRVSLYRSENLINLCNTIDLLPVSINNKFVIIHFRSMGFFDNNVNDLEKIILWSRNEDSRIPVVIFWRFPFEIQQIELHKKYDNLIFTSNLQLYASYLHHNNCFLFITEWSGGGQLSQYLTKGTICYYFRKYPPEYINTYKEYYSLVNMDNLTIYTHWDFKKTTDAKVVMFDTVDRMVNSNVNVQEGSVDS